VPENEEPEEESKQGACLGVDISFGKRQEGSEQPLAEAASPVINNIIDAPANLHLGSEEVPVNAA
jgi:hypothetical protein